MSFDFSLPSGVLLHISTRPYYREGFDAGFWIKIDCGVFAGCQIAALAYFLVVVICYRKSGSRFLLELGILMQLLASGFLAAISTLSMFMALGFVQEFLLMPPAFLASFAARPEAVPETWLAATVTFLLAWGTCRLLLIPVKGTPHKWQVSFVHAGVMHPIAFPIGQLVGLMHAIYIVRTARRQHGG